MVSVVVSVSIDDTAPVFAGAVVVVGAAVFNVGAVAVVVALLMMLLDMRRTSQE